MTTWSFLRPAAFAVPALVAAWSMGASAADPELFPANCASNPTGTSSCNTVIRNIPISFKEDDFGLIVDLVYSLCNASDVTSLANGPYRRVSNAPGPTKVMGQTVISSGDARHDMVVFTNNGSSGLAAVSAAQLAEQIGVTLLGTGQQLAADVQIGSTVTVTDRTKAGGNTAQLVDAGTPGADSDDPSALRTGGLDAVMLVKNGQPKTATIICDQNMWYSSSASGPVRYGLKDFPVTEPVNQLHLFWTMGPSGAGSAANIVNICKALVPGYPISAENPGNVPPAVWQDDTEAKVKSYATGATYLREVFSVAAAGRGVRAYGQPELPMNETSCHGIIAFCDESEPIPAEGGKSGNACNRNRGFASAPQPYYDTLNEQNDSRYTSTGGSGAFFNFP